ncbi:MAG TPA: TetR family transcriptional regulator C-terminal domain-containing protein [Streptosporangiaceae bacterium]|nr:TetR family transcriptional regulator C-terminal domain-containing protein [Streptosporangiaceae bacterium]
MHPTQYRQPPAGRWRGPAQLRTAQAAGDMPAGLDPDLEAISLMTMSAGLGTSVLGGHSSPGQAQAVIDYYLDRLFPRPGRRS